MKHRIMKKQMLIFLWTVLFCIMVITPAMAHFQMIMPSDDMVSQNESRHLKLNVIFTHPFEGHGMNMKRPVQVGVMVHGKKISLLKNLKKMRVKGRDGKLFTAYKTFYNIKAPGDHIFYVEPRPYWEPSEEQFIVHYAKVVVNAFGMEEGWDQEVGLKTEIVPLTRPYGLWAGNVFQGIVKLHGKPVPFATIEVEYYNKDGRVRAPADPMITQVIKADKNGVFTYAIPRAGWWGFAALNIDDKPMIHNGKKYPVEIGAILWIKAYDINKYTR